MPNSVLLYDLDKSLVDKEELSPSVLIYCLHLIAYRSQTGIAHLMAPKKDIGEMSSDLSLSIFILICLYHSKVSQYFSLQLHSYMAKFENPKRQS